MSVFKNLLDYVKLNDEDEDEDYDDYVSELEEKERKRAEKQEQRQAQRERKAAAQAKPYAKEESQAPISVNTTNSNSATNLNDARKERVRPVERNSNNNVSKVVPLRSNLKGLEVCIMKPTSFEDSQDICDMLLSGRAAVINLEGFDVEVAQRVMDFISGAVYALNGKLHQISSYIFIISPDTVDISGDYLDLIRQNGFEVPTLNKEF
ncbi:MAG: DUF552 domain-containing protein [Lachnospiraceae bacterium]|nr:DUF552 domain-containing protein [Lachnospiraceae bacterium]